MFTGLIEKTATLIENRAATTGNRLIIKADFNTLQAGESIAVNGVCLTLLPGFDSCLSFDLSEETLAKSTLGSLKAGEQLNLERAMSATTRFGGHYVSGHVDRTVTIQDLRKDGSYLEMTIGEFTADELRFLIPKGSICLDGVSLTINEVTKSCIKVLLVPHTLKNTNLANKQKAEFLNVEFDYLSKVIAHQLSFIQQSASPIEV